MAGLAFKPGTDDTREAPSLTIVPELTARGYRVAAWDPRVSESVWRQRFSGAERHDTLEAATKDKNVVLVLTEWPELVHADWRAIRRGMRQPAVVIDGRNCLDPVAMRALGFNYRGIGRANP